MQPEDFENDKMPGRVLRHPKDYWTFIPDPLPPEITWSDGLVAALSKADWALGELAGLASMLPNPNLLIKTARKTHPLQRWPPNGGMVRRCSPQA